MKNSVEGDYKNLATQDVLDEIFQSPQNELRDEINIPLEYQSEPKLLGLIRDMDLGGRCAFDFLITTNLTKEDVLKRYYTLGFPVGLFHPGKSREGPGTGSGRNGTCRP